MSGCNRHTAAGGTASRERQVIGRDRTFPARLATSGTGQERTFPGWMFELSGCVICSGLLMTVPSQKPSLKLALFLFLIPSAAAIQALVYFPKCAAG